MSSDDLESIRIDRWLWAVRICKTRVIAADLCKRQRVTIDGQYVKSSRDVKVGQIIFVKKDGIEWQYKVLKCIGDRVGAQLAKECREDLTPQEDLDRLDEVQSSWTPHRDKGAGRPTKKDRRAIDRANEYDY